jgi:hypothetical protein
LILKNQPGGWCCWCGARKDSAPWLLEVVRGETALLGLERLPLPHVDAGRDQVDLMLHALGVRQGRVRPQPGETAPVGLARVETGAVECEVAVVSPDDLLVARLLELDGVDLVAYALLDHELPAARAANGSRVAEVLAGVRELPVLIHCERGHRIDSGRLLSALVLRLRGTRDGERGGGGDDDEHAHGGHA